MGWNRLRSSGRSWPGKLVTDAPLPGKVPCGIPEEVQKVNSRDQDSQGDHTLWQALSTPAFWVVALASSVYGLIASGDCVVQ